MMCLTFRCQAGASTTEEETGSAALPHLSSSMTEDTLPLLHKLYAAEIVKRSKGLSKSEKTSMSNYGADPSCADFVR